MPEPGPLNAADTALLDAALAALPVARDLLDADLAFHNALAAIWTVVGDANRYVDGQAPWTLRKTDPDRMATVLYVVAETVRRLAILVQPFVPGSAAALLDLLAIEADARTFAAITNDQRLQPGTALPKPQGVFPRYVDDRGVVMLVDSHCHLDFDSLSEDRAGVLARARSAGVGAMLTIGTHRANHQIVKDIAESADDIWCSVGIHPHEADSDSLLADEIVRLVQHPKVVRDRRDGIGFLLRPFGSGAARRELSCALRGGARNGPAGDRAYPECRCGNGDDLERRIRGRGPAGGDPLL